MGASATKEQGNMKSTISNGTEIELIAEICSSWGYGGKKDQVLGLIKQLNSKGYDVQYNLEPQSGGNGEYFVYVKKGGNKSIVFSNDKKHGCVTDNSINFKNMSQIILKIEELIK